MQVNDKLWGQFEVEEVLAELILSKPVQRLKGIHLGGASYLVGEKWNVTRYEHSVGVMVFIKKLGGSLEEQIAGLLHDVSHTAFSHVIDFVFDKKGENYHEEIFQQFIVETEIPTILAKYDYDYREILDDSQWKILELPAPELCADRIDYTLRDMYHQEIISQQEIADFMENIVIVDGKISLKSIATAEWFVKVYYREVIDYFLHPLNVFAYDLLAKALKLALKKGVINQQDLFLTDEEVMGKLQNADDVAIQLLLRKIHPQVKVIENKEDYDIYLKKKLRLIDPTVYVDKKLVKGSELSDEIKKMNEQARQRAERGTFVKFISHGHE